MGQVEELDSVCEAVRISLELGEPLSGEHTAHLKSCTGCRQASDVSRVLHRALGKGPEWTSGERVLEQYELLEQIGQGGQGAVFKARDLETGLIVALKVVPLDKRSVDEVLHAVGITHPNVTRINYTRTCGPFRVIVMEYVRGGTLRDRLVKGPLAEKEALTIFRGICEGVRAAHDRDVLHLDLKPGNVLLRDGVTPVVSDFGLATVSGSALKGGTEGYMAPEQERDEGVDQRADVYALGVLLADLLPHPSPRLRVVIERARTASIQQRIATVAELLDLLDSAKHDRRRRELPIVAVGLALVGTAGWMYTHRAGVQAPAESVSAVIAEVPRARTQAASAGNESGRPSPESSPALAAEQASASRTISEVATTPRPSATDVVARPPPSPSARTDRPRSRAALPPMETAKEAPTTCHPSLIDDCKRLCDLDDAASCYNAARYVQNNLRNDTAAASYFKRACDGSFADGCSDLAFCYEHARGVAKDLARAAVLYKRGCDLGSAHACGALGALYGNGEGVAQDNQRALTLFTSACDEGDPQACGNLGLAYKDGSIGVVEDKARARELLKRACRADADWCRDYNAVKGP